MQMPRQPFGAATSGILETLSETPGSGEFLKAGRDCMSEKKEYGKQIKEALRIIVFAFVLSWGLRATVVDARVVPTPLMLPTIQVNDRLLVDKISYKFTEINRGELLYFMLHQM